jgi:C-lobe and N-lobe beta barrels of Tf-binding protein B
VYGNLNGSVALTANFGSQTINGNMNLLKDNGSLFARTVFNASITTGKNEFVGTQQAVPGDSATINGGVRGNFYGPANLPSGATPPEVGGTFWVSGSNGTGAGVFRAKKQ